MIIPIGTEVRPRKPPLANYAIIALNVLIFFFTNVVGNHLGPGMGDWLKAYYSLDAARPALHQYITYQFLHGDALHLAGNMLFLWIFGNAVCDRMGGLGYALFYLSGGVFSGVAFTLGADNPIVGASGAIAAVTTAFLALFPRVHITLLVWMFIVFTFQIPAMILIVFKIILWDNVIAPQFNQAVYSNVAYSAHLGGYAFGFATALLMLAARALPRNQFDIVALWSRAGRRHGWTGGPDFAGPVRARPITVEELESRPLGDIALTPIEQLREDIALHLAERNSTAALAAYERLVVLDPQQVLAASNQIEIANHLAQAGRYEEAANAYDGFLAAYPTAPDVPEVHLFLGLICSRYLHNFERAAHHLRAARDSLRLDSQRALAEAELRQVDGGHPPSTQEPT